MTANVSKKTTAPNVLNAAPNVEPTTGIQQVIEQLEANAENYIHRFPNNYNINKNYLDILQSINTLYAVVDNLKYFDNHVMLRQIGQDMERIKEMDPEVKGFIIDIDPSPDHHHNIALLEYSTPKSAPEPALFNIGGNGLKIRQSLARTPKPYREREIHPSY